MFARRARGTGLRILLVDDAPFYRRVVCELLASRGYEVAGEAETVAAAAAGRDRSARCGARRYPPPDSDGFELAARLTQTSPWMAVLLTSSEFGHKFYARADASGARGFVSKPNLAQIEFEAFWPREDRE